jgi:ribosomal-protein-alanine N-acetyltransferase
MREALLAILAWGFEHMALNRIQAQVHPQNTASIKSLESLGFVQEGCFREARVWHGQHHDLLQYALLKRDW